jgi:hypothetical protein
VSVRKSSLLASALAAASIGGLLSEPLLAATPAATPNHRRAAGGPTNALKIRRAARKARNVKANRRNHRG